jgi:hypothetical protein
MSIEQGFCRLLKWNDSLNTWHAFTNSTDEYTGCGDIDSSGFRIDVADRMLQHREAHLFTANMN